jgi:aspartate aminotransferase
VSPLRLSARARAIEVSPTVAMSQKAAELLRGGERVLDFSVGEPDQPTPGHVTAAAVAALERDQTRYTPSLGLPELRAAVAARYREDFGLDFTDKDVAVTVGGKQALALVCQALLQPGDEAVVLSPYWPTFAEAVRLAGARPVVARTREDRGFAVTADLVRRHLGPRTRAVIVNSPGNPTGAVIAAEELLRLARLARRAGFALLYDDTYARLTFDGDPGPVLPEVRQAAREELVILGTASKTYCMTGWRIGWVLGPKELISACAALVSHSTQNPTTFAQAAAVVALRGPQDFVAELVREYRRRRDFLHDALRRIPGLGVRQPQGAFYMFPSVASFLDGRAPTSLALAEQLLAEEKVAVVPGEGFAAPGYLRLSFARSMAELEEGAQRLRRFFASRR